MRAHALAKLGISGLALEDDARDDRWLFGEPVRSVSAAAPLGPALCAAKSNCGRMPPMCPDRGRGALRAGDRCGQSGNSVTCDSVTM